MGAQENLQVARDAQDAFDAMDIPRIDALIADDIVWHEIGRDEPRRGKDELRAAFGAEGGDFEIKAKSHDIVASDDHVIALVDATATQGGRTLHYRTAEIYHVKNGQITERWAFSDDTAAIVAFFAGAS
jgi:uncharacterized protein